MHTTESPKATAARLKQRPFPKPAKEVEFVTLTEAAEQLHLSEKDVLSLIAEKKIQSIRSGSVCKLRRVDVSAFKRRVERNGRRALAEMVRLNQEMGLYD